MKYSEVRPGRIFVLRLEDGDVLHETVEQFALDHDISSAALIAVGGADEGSRLIVGPKESRAVPVVPMESELKGVHEVAGVGTLFPNEKGAPVLHMHMAAGRGEECLAGCVRKGVVTWHVLEIVLWELVDSPAVRRHDLATGFALLDFLK